MNTIKYLWYHAFTRDLSSSPNFLFPFFKSLDPNYIELFFDYLIEIGAWDTLFNCLYNIDSSLSITPHYAYFRASQYLMAGSPFRHLSNLFPCQFHSFRLLNGHQGPIYAFYDYGGLGDYVDNLTRILSFLQAYPSYSNFRLIVPDPIFALFSSSSLNPLLLRVSELGISSYHKCHISHLLAFIEQDPHLKQSRSSLNFPFKYSQENHILYNPVSGFKQDSIHNAFSFCKRSPGPSFWNLLRSNLKKHDLRSLLSSDSTSSVITDNFMSDNQIPANQFLYSTLSRILSSKLFVSVDTFSAHLSLSLGHPTLIIIPSAYDPRWSYYLSDNHTKSDPYASAIFFEYSLFVDPYIQALQLSNLISSTLAEIH